MKKIVLSVLLVAGLCLTAQAANSSWTNDAAGTWTNSANWDNGVPGISDGTNSTDVATFGLNNTASRTITVDANRNIGGMIFSGAAGTNITLSGGSFKLSNGGSLVFGRTRNDISDTISSAIVIQGDGGSATFTANGGQFSTVGITGGLTGSSLPGHTTTLTLDGTSISATASRSQNQLTTVSDGTGGGNLTIIKKGTGVWTVGLTSTFTGDFYLNEGTLRAFGAGGGYGKGTLIIGTNVVFTQGNTTMSTLSNNVKAVVNGDFTLTGSANTKWTWPMELGSATRTVTVTTTNKTFAGAISGSGGLTKAGSGELTLSGSNTYSGATTVSAGTLIGGADHAFGGTTNITVAAAATLTLTNGVLNDYIGKNAKLILNSTSVLNLGYTGAADTIGGLSLDGGTTMLPNGTYTAAQLDALPGATVTGTGSLTVGAKVFRLISITSP